MRISEWSADVCASESPERATTLSLSSSIEPVSVPGLRIDLGYFRIRYKNRVAEPISPVTSALLPVFGDFVALNPSATDVLSIVDGLTGTFANFTGAAFDPGAVAATVNDQLQNIFLQSAEGFAGSVIFLHDLGDDRTLLFKGALSYSDSFRRITSHLPTRSEEHTSELQSLMRISYAVFCLKKKHTTH